MPNKTIYISDADMPTADRAAEISGGLSPAVTQALREFVARHELREQGFEEVHVADRTGAHPSTRIFSGRLLASLTESTTGERNIWRSYVTPKENIVVVRTVDPDAVGYVFRGGLGEAVEGAINEGLKISGLGQGLGQGFGPSFGQSFGQNFGRGFGGNLFETIEGIGNRLGEQIRNHDRSSERWMGAGPGTEHPGAARPGQDPRDPRATRGPQGWQGGVIDHFAPNDQPGQQPSEAHSAGAREEQLNHNSHGAHSSPYTNGTENTENPQDTQGAGANTGTDPHDRTSASLEVFSSIEELKAAAFRETPPTGEQLADIPTSFITATEKALNTPPVEYLDI